MARVMNQYEVPVAPRSEAMLPESWRRWEDAVDALHHAREAEDFQAVGMRLRECLVAFAGEVASDELVPAGEERPQAANVSRWCDLLANFLASGRSCERLRAYLKKVAEETWSYVNWLTHARNATPVDAEIGAQAVSHLLGTFTAARLRWEWSAQQSRCERCGSYALTAGTCPKCGWTDEAYEAPAARQRREPGDVEDTPCETTSAVDTHVGPEDYRRRR